MMRTADAATLAYTKFKTRRIRLAIAVVVSGLLFVAFSAASFVARGAISSIDSFSKEGFASRYITSVQPFTSDEYGYYNNKDLIAQAKILDKKLVADKKAEAIKIGIQYDATTERLAVSKSNGPNGEEETLDMSAPQVQSILQAKREQDSKKLLDRLQEFKTIYEVKGIYNGITLSSSGMPSAPDITPPTISIIKDGKEITEQTNTSYNPTVLGIEGVRSGWTLLDDEMLKPFLLNGQTADIGVDGTIPIVAPYSAAEEILGLKKLGDSAKNAEKLDRLKSVRSNAAGKTFSVCFRNTTSTERLQQTVDQQRELLNSKNNKNYVKPDLMYDKSANVCEDVVAVRDVRDADQKLLDKNTELFQQKFGKQVAQQRKLTFRIVGVVADPPNFGSFNIESLVGELLVSNLGSGWFSPLSATVALPELNKYIASVDKTVSFSSLKYVELGSAAQTKAFAKEQACSPVSFSSMGPGLPQECEQNKQYFSINSFGSNSVAMESVRTGFSKYFVRALLFASMISALILMGTVGRVIADSRRETAVFRAIGAKRLDIAQIYVTYVVMIGLTVCVFAVGAGNLIAQILDSKYQGALTVKALLAYNSSDLSKTFRIITFDRQDMFLLAGIIMAGSLLSALGPLVSNLKRNPIKDMRDER